MDAQGSLYGTTTGGGVSGCNINGFSGCGIVFKLTSAGVETVLYRFCSATSCTDGSNPIAGLVMDSQGNIYGTTFYGGAYGYGTVFELDFTTGQETVLYSFTGGGDGEGPVGAPIVDKAGNLYGTTLHGGGAGDPQGCSSNDYVGCGTIFELTTAGQEKVLYRFCSQANCMDGACPAAALIEDGKGNFYSTTYGGGVLGLGTVFVLEGKTGIETVLHNFSGGPSDGANPHGSLVRSEAGNLYGTTMQGGTSGVGTAFKLTPATATKTSLSSSPNPSAYGQAVTFTAAVTSLLGPPSDGETVSFAKGTTVLGTGSLSNGLASFITSTLMVGTSSIEAVYSGDANFSGSKSQAAKQTISKATTTTTVASSLNPSSIGQSVTFTVKVVPQLSGNPSGNVTFYDGVTILKSVHLSQGSALYTTKALAAGPHSITATYNGSASFSGSSGVLTQEVN